MGDVARITRIYGFVTQGKKMLFVRDYNTNRFTVPNKIVSCSTMKEQQKELSDFILKETGLEGMIVTPFRDQTTLHYAKHNGMLVKEREVRLVGFPFSAIDGQKIHLNDAYIWGEWADPREYCGYGIDTTLCSFFENFVKDMGY